MTIPQSVASQAQSSPALAVEPLDTVNGIARDTEVIGLVATFAATFKLSSAPNPCVYTAGWQFLLNCQWMGNTLEMNKICEAI